MSLSLVTLVPPLYNIYKAYQEVYERYDSKVYLNVLDLGQPRIELPTGHAPKSVVASLVNTIVTNLNTYQNQRILINADRIAQQKQTSTYVNIAIILSVIVSITILAFVWISQNAADRSEQDKTYDSMYKVLLTIVFLIINAFVISIGVNIKQRFRGVNDRVRSVTFDDKLSQATKDLSGLFDLAPDSFKQPIKPTTKHVTLDNAFFESLKSESGERLVMYAQVAFDISVKFPADKLKLAQEFLSEPVLLPPFSDSDDWKPSSLLRGIQQLDPIGQLNRINDSITYFNGLIRKDYHTTSILTEDVKKKIILRIVDIFRHAGVLTNQFIAHSSIENMGYKETVSSAIECQQKCMANPATGMSYYDDSSKMCYLMTKPDAANTSLIYVGEDTPNANQTYVKPVAYDVYIASGKSDISELPSFASETYKITPGDSYLNINQAALINTETNQIVNPYEAHETIDSPAKYSELFEGSTLKDALGAVDAPKVLALRADSNTILRNIVNKSPNFIAENRINYMDVIIREVNKLDPSEQFRLDRKDIEVIIAGIFASDSIIDQSQKGTIIDILNEIPVRRVTLKERTQRGLPGFENKSVTERYIPVDELGLKLTKMTQEDFVHKFLYNMNELFSCSSGLYNLYKFYDASVAAVKRTASILNQIFICVFLCSALMLLYHVGVELLKDKLPLIESKTRQAQQSKNGIDAQEYADIFIKFGIKWMAIICIIVSILTLIWAYRTRMVKLHEYNHSILEKNAGIVRLNSKQLMQILVDNIKSGKLVAFSGDTTDELVDVHTYDDLLSSISINGEQKLLTDGFEVYDVHTKLVESIEAFNKCNALFLGNNIDLPFPTYEVSIYATILVMMLVIIIVVYMQLKPMRMFDNIKHWYRIQSELKKNIIPDPSSLGFDCNAKSSIGPSVDIVIRIVTLTLIPIVTILFATNMLAGANNLSTALYGSALYRNNECYQF